VDEVFSVGDVEFKNRSRDRIREIVKTAGTVVIVSHNFSLLRDTCTRMIYIEEGKLAAEGDPSEVIEIHKAALEKRKEQHASNVRS
jgi:teichoic acid transport system ATP-binding protein